MGLDAHLDLTKGNIKGESKQAGCADHIELISWSLGVSNSGSSGHGGGGGGGKANFQDFHFTMIMSKASPLLMLACATGQHIPEATMTVRKSGQLSGQQKFVIIKFTDLLISSYQSGGQDGGDVLPAEQISFNYSKIEFEFHVQDATGKTSKGSVAGYDLKLNKKV